jgi:hypothetical protein
MINVTEGRFMNKRETKKLKQEELNKLYIDFWKIYNPDYCEFGKTMMHRLENKQYKNKTLKMVNRTITWFIENYDIKDTVFYFRFNQFSPAENPDIAIKRKSDRYDLGTYKLIRGKIVLIYEPEN